MTMQRPMTSGLSNNDVDLGPPQTSDGLGALSAAAAANSSPSPSAIAAAATTALGLLTNNNGNDSQMPPTTDLSRSGSLGSSYRSMTGSSGQAMSPAALWGQSSSLSSVPLLSPSELTGASDGKGGSGNNNNNNDVQALLMAQVKQRINQTDELESQFQPKKRQRTSLLDSSDLLSKGLDPGNSLLSGGSSSTLSAGELGMAAGGLAPSLLRSTSNSMGAPGGAAGLGGLSNLLSPSLDINSALSGGGGVNANGNNAQIQQLLRKQQLQDLQIQQLKQQESMNRMSQLQNRDAVLQLMLQQQQQQQRQQVLSIGNGNASLAAQLKALQDQQDAQQSGAFGAKAQASTIDEATVANYMRRNSSNNKSITNGTSQQTNVLQQMQALAQQDNEGMPPPPPMVSAVSSLDSVAIMSMLLPNQQNQNQQQQSSSASNASRLLGTELSLGAAGGGLGAGANLNSSLLSPMPFPPPSLGNLGNLGMGGGAASLYGSLGGNSALSSIMGGRNAICPPAGGAGNSLALHPSAADVIYEQRRLAAAAEVSNTVRDSSVGKPPDAFVDRDPDGRAHDLPTLLVVPMDHMQLSSHQTLLRYQIEVFRAGEEDTSTHTRGRNKPVQLGQIGIRCRHCKVLPVSRRKRGSVYFPRAVEGFYQAAQNMNSTHLQTGECPLMGNALRQEFANLIATRGVSTGAGRAYWAKQARKLGLRNTENGIVFDKKEPAGASGTGNEGNNPPDTSKSSSTTSSN